MTKNKEKIITQDDLKDLKDALIDIQIRMNSNNLKMTKALEVVMGEVKTCREELTHLNEQRENQEDRLKRLERKLQKSY
jgi:hypothetical protein